MNEDRVGWRSSRPEAGSNMKGRDTDSGEAPFGQLLPSDTQMLKGVAICLMLWHHLFQGARDIGGWTWWWGRHGNICVALFLLLSGYGMSVQYGRRLGRSRFWPTACVCWLRRYWRLYCGYWPVFLLSVGIGVVVFHRGLGEAYGVDGVRKWICLVLDGAAFGGYRSYNITWWFFRLIVIFYALYPFLQLATAKYRWTWALAPLLLTGAFGWTGLFCHEWILNRWLFAFLCGMFVSAAASRWSRVPVRWGRRVWFGGVLGTLLGFYVRDKWGETLDGVLAMALTVALVPLLRHAGPLRAVLAFLGNHSMNIFMIHTFICHYYGAAWLQSFGNAWIRFAVLLSASLALSIGVEAGKAVLGVKRWAKKPPFERWLESKTG